MYVLDRGPQTLSFSRAATTVTASQYADTLLKYVGGRVTSRKGNETEVAATVDKGSVEEAFFIQRDGGRLAVTTRSAPRAQGLSIDDVRRVGGSATGGVSLRARGPGASIPLEPYQSPDRGTRALVPRGPEWSIQSNNGLLEGSSQRGAFLIGYAIDVLLPEHAPPNSDGRLLISRYLDPPSAVARLFPSVSREVSNYRLRRTLKRGVIPGYTESGLYEFDYTSGGKPWTALAIAATDRPENYGNFSWHFYFSGVGVPVGADPAVGTGLLRVWQSWDPSGAIARRTERIKQLLDETNRIWQETNEFSRETADRQARDVGCLLLGYPIIEDNSRKYDLPPLPCGEEYY